MNNERHVIELSYDVTVTTTYRITADRQPSLTRAKQQLDGLRAQWGDDPAQWPEAYGDLEIVNSGTDWRLNNVAHIREHEGFEQIDPPAEGVAL